MVANRVTQYFCLNSYKRMHHGSGVIVNYATENPEYILKGISPSIQISSDGEVIVVEREV